MEARCPEGVAAQHNTRVGTAAAGTAAPKSDPGGRGLDSLEVDTCLPLDEQRHEIADGATLEAGVLFADQARHGIRRDAWVGPRETVGDLIHDLLFAKLDHQHSLLLGRLTGQGATG